MGIKYASLTLLLVMAGLACTRPPTHEISYGMKPWPALAAAAVDADGDLVDEIYYVGTFSNSMRCLTGDYLWEEASMLPRGSRSSKTWAVDIGDDSIPDLVTSASFPGSLFVYVENVHRRPWRRFSVEERQPSAEGPAEGDICRAAFTDLDADGQKEMVLAITSAYNWAAQPRSIIAFDLVDGDTLWRFGMGQIAYSLVTGDADRDGVPEVYVGGLAPCNGCVENGIDDLTSYVFSLSAGGRLRWVIAANEGKPGGRASTALVDTAEGKGAVLVAAVGCDWESDTVDRILLLDPADGSLLRSVSVTDLKPGLVVSYPRGNRGPRIVTAEGSRVVVRDIGLNVVASTDVRSPIAALQDGGALCGPDEDDVVLVLLDGRLMVFDCIAGVVRAVWQAPWAAPQHVDPRLVQVVRRGRERSACLLVATDDEEPIRRGDQYAPVPIWALLNVVETKAGPVDYYWRQLVAALQTPWGYVCAGIAMMMLLASPFVLYSRASYREFVRYVTRGMVERAGVVMFSSRGRVTSINKRATELLVLPKGVRTGILEGLLMQPSFASLRAEFAKVKEGKTRRAVADVVLEVDGVQRTFRAALSRLRLGGYLLSLEDLAAVEYARRVAAWGPVAQRLAHGIKTPLSTIRLTAQAMEGADPEGAKVIEEEVDRLAKMTDGFMRLADFEPPRLEPKDMNTVVRRVLDELGVGSLRDIELRLDLAEGLPQAQLDEEQVVRALGNLVNNAVGAMGGKGRLAVGTRFAAEKPEVVVTVSDTGPGIPSEYLAKLFQPFFTRKAGGTGLGLTIVRKVAEDHGGRVEVESEPGKGATFRFILPVPRPVA